MEEGICGVPPLGEEDLQANTEYERNNWPFPGSSTFRVIQCRLVSIATLITQPKQLKSLYSYICVNVHTYAYNNRGKRGYPLESWGTQEEMERG